KGKIGTVPVYPALGLRERFGERWETSEEATPLIGRDREMVALLDAWVRAQAGEGQLVTVIGDAGVGKSRLIAELIDKVASGSSVRVVRARCLSYGQEISLWLLADLLRSLFGIAEGESLEEIHAKLSAPLPSLLNRSSAETQSEALDVLGEVLGLPPGSSPVAQAGPQIRRQTLIRIMKLMLGVLSERAPIILVLEDMHWVDQASGEVLTEVLGDVPGLRMMSLVAQRPGWNAPWSEWGWTERLTLRPLREGEAALLAGAVLGGMRLSAELEHHVAERASGNPFFVEELLRALEETGGLVQRNGAMYLAPGTAERLPSTLTEVLLARLDRLEGQVRNVAQVASVIGRSFAVRLLAQVMEREQTELELPLSALQQAEIAFPRRGSDLEYVFKHVTMREVAYNTLVHKRRQQLHLDTARAIAALYPSDEYVEIIAYHYSKTEEHGEAAGWLERAGDRAAGIYANETAIANYQEARQRHEITGSAPAVLALLDEKLGVTYHTAGRYDEAIPVLERAVEAYRGIRDLDGAGRAAALLGRAYDRKGASQEGLSQVEPLVELLTWSGPSPTLAELYLTLAILFTSLGRYDDMLIAAERSAEIAEAVGDERVKARALERRGSALSFLGRNAESIPALEEVIPMLERIGDLDGLQVALGNMGEDYRLAGELEEARRYNEQAVEVSERVGNPAHIAFLLTNLAQILLTLGQWEEAGEYLERASQVLLTHSSASSFATYIPGMKGQLRLAQGEWHEAEPDLMQALRLAEASGDRQALEMIHSSLAELEILRGQPDAAVARLEPLAGQEGAFRVIIESTLGWAYLELTDVDRAAELAAGAVRRGREQEETLALVDSLRILGMVLQRQGQASEALDVFEEGLALARKLPYPYAEARILERLGRLEEAFEIFQRLGAAKDVARTEPVL
ncbi:MAG TPA: tetratricopeptide repeat protein, partial [Chloroflexota bacterium]